MKEEYKVITDDTECELFLAQSGILDKVKEYHKKNTGGLKGVKNTIFAFKLEDTYVLSVLISGHEIAEENGYLVSILSMDHFSEIEATDYFTGCALGFGATESSMEIHDFSPQSASLN